MGEVIELENYRASKREAARNGLCVEVLPPVVLVKYYRNGVLVGQERVISEYMLRELLDRMT